MLRRHYMSITTRRPLLLDSSAAVTMAKLRMLSWHSLIGTSPVRKALTKSASEPAIPSPAMGPGGASMRSEDGPSAASGRTSATGLVAPSQVALPNAPMARHDDSHEVSRP